VNARCELFSIFTSNLIVGKKFTLDLYQINKEIVFLCTNDLRRRRDINFRETPQCNHRCNSKRYMHHWTLYTTGFAHWSVRIYEAQ